jgi:hypothetical protein
MSELRDLLERGSARIDPGTEALERIARRVRWRRRRRRAAATGAAAVVVTAGLVVLAAPGIHEPSIWALPGGQRIDRTVPESSREIGPYGVFAGPADARLTRAKLGIVGSTKGAPAVVLTRKRSAEAVRIAVDVQDGQERAIPIPQGASDVTVSGDGQMAAITRDGVAVGSANGAPTTIAATKGARDVTWDSKGHALFAVVRGSWYRIDGKAGARPVRLTVPAVGGTPILLSSSPGGDQVALFALARSSTGRSNPRVYVGRFDGQTVWSLRELAIPATAVSGPMGWVGDNAFLLSPGSGRALILRTDGTRVMVSAIVPDPCAASVDCVVRGPRLLGTNGDGSLLFWKVKALRATDPSAGPVVVLYYETWLDGSHASQLTGVLGRLGPPVAPR